MTYPDPRYTGEGGQVSATHRAAGHEPDLTYPNGTKVHYLATRATTDGLFGLYRWEMAAGPGGPDPHFHRTIAESFYVLSGTIRIFDGARWLDTVAGDFVHVPPGGIHAFRNESGRPASMLIHFAPGAPREAYFEGLPRFADASDAERTAFVRSHDQYPADG
jgi:mannose-6-phosphate isomerase-like protein (cupin superfamily)